MAMMIRWRRRDSHHLGTKACAGAQISLPYNTMPVLYQSSAPHITVVLGKCVSPAPEQEEMGLTPLSSCFLSCPVNLSSACPCLCAHQSISARATSPGLCSESGVRTPRRRFRTDALRGSRTPKEPAGNRALVIDPHLSPPSSWMSACCHEQGPPSHLPARAEDSCALICSETFVTHPLPSRVL